MEGDQKCCVMKLRVQFGEVSPLENLGPDRIWHKQVISRSVTWMWLRVLSISEKSFSQEAAATTQDGGRMVSGLVAVVSGDNCWHRALGSPQKESGPERRGRWVNQASS